MTSGRNWFLAVLALAGPPAFVEAQQTPAERTIHVFSDVVLEGPQAQTLTDRFRQGQRRASRDGNRNVSSVCAERRIRAVSQVGRVTWRSWTPLIRSR
jgi:hypothetical protein